MSAPTIVSFPARRTRIRFALGAGLAALVTAALVPVADAAPAHATGGWQPEPARYGVSAPLHTSVRMDDGVSIAVEVVYPTDPATGARTAGTFPVLLTQNPYGAGRSDPTTSGNYFVQRGYIYVASAVRGTGDSGGQVSWFGDRQGRDGAELVDWIAHALPGSNGVVGLDGCSYLGVDQWFTAQGHHPVLHGFRLLQRPDRRRWHPNHVRRGHCPRRAPGSGGRSGHRSPVRHHRPAGERWTALLQQRLLARAERAGVHAEDRRERYPGPDRDRLEGPVPRREPRRLRRRAERLLPPPAHRADHQRGADHRPLPGDSRAVDTRRERRRADPAGHPAGMVRHLAQG